MELNFTQRTEKFWSWFKTNEQKLSEMVSHLNNYDSDEMVAIFSEGTKCFSENLHFNVGGDHEFTFAVSGDESLFYLLPHVAANLPEEYRTKWHFFPCMNGTKGKDFALHMHGVKVAAQDVKVSLTIEEGAQGGAVTFYHKQLASLPENECYSAFYILMENIIGEALACMRVEKVELKKPRMFGAETFPLTLLEEKLTAAFYKNGETPDPAQRVFTYQRTPDESDALRDDIFIGFAHYADLLNSYYANQEECFHQFTEYGAVPAFLFYEYDPQADRHAVLDERNEIMDRLEGEILGIYESAGKCGLILGGAMGEKRAYIDILLFDFDAFTQSAADVLKDYSQAFFLSQFVRGGEVTPL